MTSAHAHKPSPDDTSLEDAVSAVTAAEEALREARRNLTAAITAARQAGESIPRIAHRTGMDAVTVRNILAVTAVPAQSPR
ncbi:hypothetical protein, partial [Streptomyces sp. NPDC094468]|uniref:hypothetical protein n=1 Tax=Streptomyces sp. NPDC094468 TaxID=3366066 RepID=UPI0037F6A142